MNTNNEKISLNANAAVNITDTTLDLNTAASRKKITSDLNTKLKLKLKNMSDKSLLQASSGLVVDERERLPILLLHFFEIDSRKLYADQGYKSMYEFLAVEYKYSSDQAYRRLQAMRLLQDLPEIESKINSGDLNLTNISLMNKFFKEEEKYQDCEISKQDKLHILSKIENKSTREVEQIALAMSSNPEVLNAKLQQPDQVKLITEEKIEIKFLASKQLENKIKTLKGLMAYTHPDITLGEMFEYLCDLGIQHLDKSKTKKEKKLELVVKASDAEAKTNRSESFGAPKKMGSVSKGESKVEAKYEVVRSRSVAQVRRQVFAKAGNVCEKCKSQHALEIDHIKPKAMGGADDIDNLRVLCRSCNQRAAIKSFGQQHMQRFLF